MRQDLRESRELLLGRSVHKVFMAFSVRWVCFLVDEIIADLLYIALIFLEGSGLLLY